MSEPLELKRYRILHRDVGAFNGIVVKVNTWGVLIRVTAPNDKLRGKGIGIDDTIVLSPEWCTFSEVCA